MKVRATIFYVLAAGALAFIFGAVSLHPAIPTGNISKQKLPATVLWAWEGEEDLSYIDPKKVAVAFHTAHVRVERGEIHIRRRHHRLIVPAGTKLLAVAHFSVADADPRLIEKLRNNVIDLVEQPGVIGLQLDYEAVASQRDFYKQLATDIRGHLSQDYMFTATALASWCLGDTWMDPRPFDEITPMLFDMGRPAAQIRRTFAAGGDFVPEYCKSSVGLKLGEQAPALFPERRIYIFNPSPWNADDYRKATALYP